MCKKKFLALCVAVGVTASLAAATDVLVSTVSVSEAVVDVTEDVEMTEAVDVNSGTESNADMNSEPAETENLAVDNSINLKSPIENEDGSVTLYGEVLEGLGEGVYLVQTVNGPFEITVSEDTEVLGDGQIEVGEYIEFVSDGVATMSLPGQMHTIFRISEIAEEAAMVNTDTTMNIAECLPEVERLNDGLVVYHGWIKSLIGDEQMLVITHDGEKIINITEELLNGNEYATGELITFMSDGIESRSIPAQITNVNSIEHMEEVLAKQTQASIDRSLEALNNTDGADIIIADDIKGVENIEDAESASVTETAVEETVEVEEVSNENTEESAKAE